MGLGKAIYNGLKNVCTSLGKHNDALYAVLAIAMFKGIMRPTFTMMDKKSDKETKKYAAFREGLTEVIAFGSYIATHAALVPLSVKWAKKAGVSPKKLKNGVSLFSVCLSAGVIIPAVCNLTLKPIMDGVKKLSEKKNKMSKIPQTEIQQTPSLNIKENEHIAENFSQPIKSLLPAEPKGNLLQIMQKNYTANNNGMRVGL